ncbi:MAG: hypothetical protein ACYSSP_12035 [Planctomycetota bacterium]|jgi:hypothetical protein
MSEKKILPNNLNDTFDEEISLHRLILSPRTKEKLLILINSSINANTSIPPLLLTKATARTVGLAVSNTIGCLEFYESYASNLGAGINVFEFCTSGSVFTTYFIKDIERLLQSFSFTMFKLITQGILNAPAYYPDIGAKPKSRKFEGVLILSTKALKRVPSWITENVEIIEIQYLEQDLYKILLQRIELWHLKVEKKDEVIGAILQVCRGDIGRSIHILKWLNRFVLTKVGGDRTITVTDLNIVLHLLC